MSQEGIVFFLDNIAKSPFRSQRFKVGLYIPEITKLYFNPEMTYNTIAPDFNFFESHYLSNVLHGTPTNTAPGTRTKIYDPPFFLVFKIPGASSNYLSFTDYKKPNSESSILAMLRYDDEKLMLKNEYSTEMILPYNHDLCLSEVLEFTLYDSKNRIVRVSDASQLFILLTLL